MNIAVHPAELIQKFLLKFANTYYRPSEKEKQQRFAQNVKAVFQGTLSHIFTQLQKSSVSQPLSQARVGTLVFWEENQQTQLGLFLEKTTTHFRVYPINPTNLFFQSAELTTNQVQILGCFPPSFLSEELTGNFTSDISYPTPPGFKMYYVEQTPSGKNVVGIDDAFLTLTGQSSERQWFIDAWNLLRQTSLGEDLYQRFTTNNPQSGQPEDIVFLGISNDTATAYGTTTPSCKHTEDYIKDGVICKRFSSMARHAQYVDITDFPTQRLHIVTLYRSQFDSFINATETNFKTNTGLKSLLITKIFQIYVQKLAETIYHELRYHIDWDPNNNMINVTKYNATTNKFDDYNEHNLCGDYESEAPFYIEEFYDNNVPTIDITVVKAALITEWDRGLNNVILPDFDLPETQQRIKEYNETYRSIPQIDTANFLMVLRNKIINEGNYAFKSQMYLLPNILP